MSRAPTDLPTLAREDLLRMVRSLADQACRFSGPNVEDGVWANDRHWRNRADCMKRLNLAAAECRKRKLKTGELLAGAAALLAADTDPGRQLTLYIVVVALSALSKN